MYSGSEYSRRQQSISPGPSARTRSTTRALPRPENIQARTSAGGRQDNFNPRETAGHESLGQDHPTGPQAKSMTSDEEDDDEASAEQIAVIIEELSDRLRDYRARGTTLMGVCDSMYAMTRRRRSPEVVLRRVKAKGGKELRPIRFYPPPQKYLHRGASDTETE